MLRLLQILAAMEYLNVKWAFVLWLLWSLSPPIYSQVVDCHVQTIVLSARDKHGALAAPIETNELRASGSHQDLTILTVRKGTPPRKLLIILDASGSMDSDLKQNASRAISADLIRGLPADIQIGLILYGEKSLATVPFGHSRSELLSAIESFTNFRHWGRTALRDGLLYARDQLKPAELGDSVVVVSDGGDNQSRANSITIERTYRSEGLRIIFVEFQSPFLQTAEEISGALEFARLAEATGGAVEPVIGSLSDPRLAAVARSIQQEILNYEVVRIGSAKPLSSPVPLRLSVVNSRGAERKDIKLARPKQLLPCGPDAASN